MRNGLLVMAKSFKKHPSVPTQKFTFYFIVLHGAGLSDARTIKFMIIDASTYIPLMP